jgi:hypothetical protein
MGGQFIGVLKTNDWPEAPVLLVVKWIVALLTGIPLP